MNRFREMQVFLAVAEAGSLAAAARAVGLSIATVMRTLATLEARLNAPLLLRGARGTGLSPAGMRFAASCRQILAGVEQAECSAIGQHAHPAGQLTLSAPLLMSHQVLTPVVLDYLAAYPEVSIVTETREDLPRLVEDGIDVALVVGHLPDSSGFAIAVGAVAPIVCAAPAYLQQWGRPLSPDDLAAHQTIVTSSTGHVAEWRFRGEHGVRLVRPAPRLNCTTQQAAIRAAVSGLGLVRCMSHEAHRELQSGLLVPVLSDFALPSLPAHLIYREGRRAAARTRTFIDFSVPLLRAHPALRGA
ncbi:LysR family transcriptional regulator [Pseudomonas sp. PDM15]|uniref:LysR family transcriptional regulator n=1 Tax=Pseudomonas sp. PDM15 TaxID=2769303 RepID=UPI00177B3F42|nr:LysR family transcriptional regulator [Pseudomonas sp. PDM15]MBD9425095.1 LysR family transcriptional regulator [Pseudomonas sp. PDM15]